MTIVSRFSFSVAIALASSSALPSLASAQAMVQPLPGTTDADRLADQMRALAANPSNVDALVTAGELSLKLGDLSGAASLFARADKVDPQNGRVKAGMGSILVRSERPGEALRYFSMAEGYGIEPRRMAADRGLAYDLIGEQERAQRDYRLALKTDADDETVRRYALSLGIAGKRDLALAQLDGLLRRNDRGAWRARAFVLAMTGDEPGAERIATTMMPPGMAEGLQPFFVRLPGLGAADRAFAVHFGEVHASADRIADARMVPPLPALLPEPSAPVAVAAVQPVAVKQAKKSKAKKRDLQVGRVALAAADTSSPALAALPPPPTYRPAPSGAALASLQPTYRPPITTVSPTLQPGYRTGPTGSTPATVASSYPAARTTVARAADRPLTAAEAASMPVLAGRLNRRSSRNDLVAAVTSAPTPPVTLASTVVRAPAATSPAVTGGASVRAPVPAIAPVVAARPALVVAAPVQVTSVTPLPGRAGDVPAVAAATAPSVPAPVTVASATPAAATPAMVAASESSSVPSVVTAARPASAIAAAQPPAPRAGTMSREGDAVLARIIAGLSVPATELDVAAPPPRAVRPVAAPITAARVVAEATAKEARDDAAERVLSATAAANKGARRGRVAKSAPAELAAVADRTASTGKSTAADRKALAAKKAVEDKKLADAKAAAEDKKAKRADPARTWVQVAGGANEDDLPKAWAAVRGKAPALFAGKQAWTTPLRATNRVLAGPFKTDAEARAYVNQLGKAGVSAFTFSSDPGQKVTRLPTK